MDLLITVIGNAVLDSVFREHLLKDPIEALDNWGFRLTKHETGTLRGMVAGDKEELKSKFKALEELLYNDFERAATLVEVICPKKRCFPSVYPRLAGVREALRKAAEDEFEAQKKAGQAA